MITLLIVYQAEAYELELPTGSEAELREALGYSSDVTFDAALGGRAFSVGTFFDTDGEATHCVRIR